MVKSVFVDRGRVDVFVCGVVLVINSLFASSDNRDRRLCLRVDDDKVSTALLY